MSNPDARYDPPNIPDPQSDEEYLSTCCGANSETETFEGEGICSYCGEHATFEDNNGEIEG